MPIPKKKTVQLLFMIVLLAAGLRLWGLGNNAFVADEFLDMNSSYGYFKTGEWSAWDFNYGQKAQMNSNAARDERAAVYKWQVASLYRVLAPTEATARLVSVLWGLASVVLMFWTGYFYTRKKAIGLLAAFLCALSISAIIFDRRLRMYAMFFPVFLAFATTLFAFFEVEYAGKKVWLRKIWTRLGVNGLYLVPVLFLGALSFATHGLSVSIFPILGIYFLIRVALLWRQERSLKNKYAVGVGIGLFGLVLVLLFFPHSIRVFTQEIVWFDNHYTYILYILRDFAHPLLGLLLAGFGSYFLARELKRPKAAVFLSVAVCVPLAMAVWFWRRNVGAQYIFFAQSFLMLLTATGMYGVLRFVERELVTLGKRRVLVTLVLLLLLIPNYSYFFEENNTYHETSSGGNPNYRKVFDYFKKNKQPGDVLITRNFRNYYFAGAAIPVYDFGGELAESKFSLSDLQSILAAHPHGWLIISTNDYDYISQEAEIFFKQNMERVSNSQVRGAIEVYRW